MKWIVLLTLSALFIFLQCLAYAQGGKIIAGDHLFSVHFVSEKEGWTVGARGAIYHSLDGGLNWERQKVKTTNPLFSISFCNPRVGWVVGKSGTIFHTIDGGKTWNEQTAPKKKHLFTVEALSPEKCWAAGDWGTILYTEDGGKTWIDRTYPKDMVIYDIEFQGPDEGWMAGEFGSILYTKDGGKNWSPQRTGIESTLFSVSFTSKKEGLAAGLDGKILRTEDGGRIWSSVDPANNWPHPSGQPGQEEEKLSLYEVKLSGKLGIAVGDAGRIIFTQDGGKTWAPFHLPIDMNLFWFRGVALVNGKSVIVGARSIVIITQDDKMKALGFLPTVRLSKK